MSYVVQCERYSGGSASRTHDSNASPSAALAHNASTALSIPPIADFHAHREERKKHRTHLPHPPSHPSTASLSVLHPQTTTHDSLSLSSHLPGPLPAAYTKLLSHHPNLNLTFPYPISFYSYCILCATRRPLVTGLAGDEREEFSVRFGFLLASPDCSLEWASVISLSTLSNFTDNINMKRSLICSSSGPAGCHVVTLGPCHVIDGKDGASVLGPARNRC